LRETPAPPAALPQRAAPLPEAAPPQDAPAGEPPLHRVPEQPSPLEAAVQRVKERPEEIAKYVLHQGDAILVKGILGPFEVEFDLLHAQRIGPGEFWVDFAVTHTAEDAALRDQFLWRLEEDQAGILLAFDDQYHEAWERHLAVFDQYGAKVTFFVQGDPVPFCLAAQSQGHEVGYHTQNHLNLTQVSRETFFEETLAALDRFRSAGIPLQSFAYPYGLSEPWMHEELLPFFKILRGYGVTFRLYTKETIKTGYIVSKALDNILYKEDAAFEAALTLMLRTVKFMGGTHILPLTTHDISETALWGISPQRLHFLLQTARDLGLRFYRYQDLW
jgi:peptidoglycan/xylan/chitin deacetylase (PgdA/CDA1 family)